jgi:hypothetical protein
MPRAAIARSRAPTLFSARMKSASAQKTRLWIKTRTVQGFYTRSSIARGCAFHPRAIEDPRGRLLVRATSQLRNIEKRYLNHLVLKQIKP